MNLNALTRQDRNKTSPVLFKYERAAERKYLTLSKSAKLN